MRALVTKDIWINWKRFLVACSLIIALVLIAEHGRPPRGAAGFRSLEQLYLSSLFFTEVLLFTEWLIVREVTHRTIVWLRSFPISDWILIGSKFVLFALMQWTAVAITIWALPFSLLATDASRIAIWALVVQFLGGVTLGSRLAFGAKNGLLGVMAFVIAGSLISALGHLHFEALISNQRMFAPALCIGYVAAYVATVAVMVHRDAPGWAIE